MGEDFYSTPNKDAMTAFLAEYLNSHGEIPAEYLAIVSKLDGEGLTPPNEPLPDNTELVWPTDSSEITLWYGQIDELDTGIHAGTNIQGEAGSPVYAICNGVVSYTGTSARYGNILYIDFRYKGAVMQARYGNLEASTGLRVGQMIKKGTTLGSMGVEAATGKGLIEIVLCESSDDKVCSTSTNNYHFVDPTHYLNLSANSGDYLQQPMAVMFDNNGLAPGTSKEQLEEPVLRWDPGDPNEAYRRNQDLRSGECYLRKSVEIYAVQLEPDATHANITVRGYLTWDNATRIATVKLNGKMLQYGEPLGNARMENNRVIVNASRLRLDLFGTETPIPVSGLTRQQQSDVQDDANSKFSSLGKNAQYVLTCFDNPLRRQGFDPGIIAALLINAGDSWAMVLQGVINLGNQLTCQLPTTEYYEKYLTDADKVNTYFADASAYLDSYYLGKTVGDAAVALFGTGMAVKGVTTAIEGGITAAAGVATLPEGVGAGIAVAGAALALEGVSEAVACGAVALSAIGKVSGDLSEFLEYDKYACKNTAEYVREENRGSTGRKSPRDLEEQIAMNDALKDPFDHIPGSRELYPVGKIGDDRWKGWKKWQITFISSNGRKITIHFNYDSVNNLYDDFKFK